MTDNTMVMDCDVCPVRGKACSGCVMQVLATEATLRESVPRAVEGPGLPLTGPERAAVDVFRRAGLVTADEARSARAEREAWGSHVQAV